MAIGWFLDLPEAETYFAEERLETRFWDEAEDDLKSKALKLAYNRIFYNPNYSVPDYATATAAELIILTKAQAEYSYYLLEHQGDEDSRKGLQAQAVIEAGVVKEKYDKDAAGTLPVPPFVAALLGGFVAIPDQIKAANLARDEDESADAKVHDF